MPRSLWNGTIAFGQVNVPVKVYSAVQSKTVSFREVHLADGARIEHRRFCTEEDEEIPYAEETSIPCSSTARTSSALRTREPTPTGYCTTH